MTGVSTHVLDTSTGRPAAGVAVRLLRLGQDDLAAAVPVADGRTDQDGRWSATTDPVPVGGYRLEFATGQHFAGRSFHPRVAVDFTVVDPDAHHHVPLLLSPFGYTTYRGS